MKRISILISENCIVDIKIKLFISGNAIADIKNGHCY